MMLMLPVGGFWEEVKCTYRSSPALIPICSLYPFVTLVKTPPAGVDGTDKSSVFAPAGDGPRPSPTAFNTLR